MKPITTPTKKQVEAFNKMADAIGAYLETVGWKAMVIGGNKIQQPIGSAKMNFEFVVTFTGGKKKNAD